MITVTPTRGELNCNPGNINYNPANQWQGQLGLELHTPARFARFSSDTYGIRALACLLHRYILRGENTLTAIANTWAPSNENDSDAYAKNLAAESGLSPAETLTPDAATLEKLCAAIIVAENGRNIYQAVIIMNAVNLALS